MPQIAPLIVGAIGLTGTVASIATGVINIGLSLGLSFASSKLLKKKAPPPAGLVSDMQVGGAVSRAIHFGHHVTAGHLTYINSYDHTNNWLQRVYALSDWHGGQLLAVWDDEIRRALTPDLVPAGNNEDARYFVGGYQANWVVRYFTGSEDQLADTELINHAQPAGRMGSEDRGRGISYVSQTYIWAKNLWKEKPNPVFERQGDLLYDWRKDDTAGGVGPHRWTDPLTWEPSDNPIVQLYNFMRGFYRAGQLILGMGVPAAKLSLDHFTAAANICDEPLTEGGNIVARYVASISVRDEDEWRVAIRAFLDACAGDLFEVGGIFMPVAGAAQVSVATLTEKDLLDNPETKTSYSGKRGRADLFNEIHGTYINTDAGWSATAYESVSDPAWLVEDNNEPLRRQQDFNMVPSGWQAGRLAQIAIRRNRLQASAIIEVPFKWLRLTPGDWITFTCQALGTRTYRIEEREIRHSGNLVFKLEEISAWVYGDEAVSFTPPVAPPNEEGVKVTTVSNLNLQAITIAGDGGQKRPAFRVTWDAPDDPTITHVVVQFGVAGSGAYSVYDTDDPESGEMIIQSDILASTNYQVRATINTRPPRPATFTPWVTVLSSAESVVAASVAAEQATGDLASAMDNLYERHALQAEEINKRSLTLAGKAAEENLRAFLKEHEIDTSLTGVKADITETQTLLTDETTARAAADTAIQTQVDGNAALIATNATAISDETTARASADTAIQTQVDGNAALIATNATAISDETTARAAADTAIQTLVDGNAALIATNATAISDETMARAAADTALLTLVDSNAAQITTNATAISDETTARAAADTAIQTLVDGNAALIATNATAISDETTARASAVSAVQANLDDAFAAAGVKFEAVAAPTGVEARFVIAIKGGSATSHVQGGLMLDLVQTSPGVYESRFVLDANQIYLSDLVQIINGVVTLGATELVSFLQSAGFVSGQTGWRLNADGTFELGGGVFYGETSANATWTFGSVPMQNGIPLGETTFNKLKRDGYPDRENGGFYTVAVNWVKRTPDNLSADFNTNAGVTFTFNTRSSPLAAGDKWAKLTYPIGSTWVLELDADGSIWQRAYDGNGVVYEEHQDDQVIYPLELDPLNEAGVSGTGNVIVAKNGWAMRPQLVRVYSSTLRFRAWGAGGANPEQNQVTAGGPGGYVDATFTGLTVGELLTVYVGQGGLTFGGAPTLGLGGATNPNSFIGSGGGATILIRGTDLVRANVLAIAGGGGSSVGGYPGGPGGATNAGGNGVSGEGAPRMTGVTGVQIGTLLKGAGGGGYEGGGVFSTANVNSQPGKGGTSFVAAGATNVTTQAIGIDAHGSTVSDVPPHASDADFIANKEYYTGRRPAGHGGWDIDLGAGGNGLALLEWL